MQYFRKPPRDENKPFQEYRRFAVGTLNVATMLEIGNSHPIPDILAVPVKQLVEPAATFIPTKYSLIDDDWLTPYPTKTPNISCHPREPTSICLENVKCKHGNSL